MKKRGRLLPLMLLAALGVFSFVWLVVVTQYRWYDFLGQWRFCAYTLRGVDIYTLRGSENFIAEIGEVGAGFHATPWGLLLQNIFYGGFMPYETAGIYFIAVSIASLILASFMLYVKSKDIDNNLGLYAFIMSILSADFLIGLNAGNAGAAVCAFLVIAWALSDEHEYIAGVFAGIAMMKPQDALIVCFVFLLCKKFKSLITVAAVDIAAWFMSSILLKKGMIELLIEFLSASDRKTGFVAGIFHPFFENYVTAIAMSMLLGIVFVFLLCKFLPKNMPGLFKVYPACMTAIFWCYSYSTDCCIMIIPAILCIWLMFQTESPAECMFWFLASIYCSNAVSVWSKMQKVAALMLRINASWYVYKTIYGTGLIILGIIICIKLRSIYSEEKS